ncbi:nuclear transport factor 2 family protein [Pedobacter sandarakinus]|uniref:nuclear transport factor 2 family protein n=1 Tax=Pedobacter sandarakinus TaxID=353156 RepID=UPI0022479157|nr:nuclear transport factor 2 family protein [Pedobacter sandarakinus]MCX2575310.1 nuclear transport factor 2 family protein [Pedobacter sandarakinus]
MKTGKQELIEKAYAAFNRRDIDEALMTFHPDVEWPKAFEGGYVQGHSQVRSYWTRQWSSINPTVDPIQFSEREDGTMEITVHQKVKDLENNIIFDGLVKHIYTVVNGL